jgi:hypothetical protein
MKLSAAQVIARIQDRFDLARQTARHTPQALLDKFNDASRDVQRTLFNRGCKKNLKTVTFLSTSATDVAGTYPGQRIDNFSGGGSPVFAERIRSVDWLSSSGVVRLSEVTWEQASDYYGSDTDKDNPTMWFPIGPIDAAAGASVGVCVAPRLLKAESFRITYLPPHTTITITPDVGCDDMMLPLEAVLMRVGVLLAIRDEDTSLTTFRQTLYQQALEDAISDQSMTQSCETMRSPSRGVLPRGLDRS